MEINSHIVTTPPRDASSVVLLRDGAEGLEVFLMRRANESDVLGGAYVFPGGKLDEADALLAHTLQLDHPADQLVARLGEPGLTPETALALYVAAVREAYEECGVLLAHEPPNSSAVADLSFAQRVQADGVHLTLSGLVPWSRWVTPRQASLMNKRFDTRFFLVAMPSTQQAVHDDHETTHSEWMTPRDALTRYWARELAMAPPQIMSLVQLARHSNVDSALVEASMRLPPTIEPEPFDENGMRVICYPGDERHSNPCAAIPGPTRLMFRNKRFEPSSGTLDELLAGAHD
jgi:8-oxo-dGTP pyrophosphatase MutT (NUDIX family)